MFVISFAQRVSDEARLSVEPLGESSTRRMAFDGAFHRADASTGRPQAPGRWRPPAAAGPVGLSRERISRQ
jgi:hypothetical protein